LRPSWASLVIEEQVCRPRALSEERNSRHWTSASEPSSGEIACQRQPEGWPPQRPAKGDGDAQDHAPAVVAADADGGEHGTGTYDTIDADLFIAGIEDEMADGRDGPLAPRFKHGTHLGGGTADLGGGDFQPAEFLQDLGHPAGGTEAERR